MRDCWCSDLLLLLLLLYLLSEDLHAIETSVDLLKCQLLPGSMLRRPAAPPSVPSMFQTTRRRSVLLLALCCCPAACSACCSALQPAESLHASETRREVLLVESRPSRRPPVPQHNQHRRAHPLASSTSQAHRQKCPAAQRVAGPPQSWFGSRSACQRCRAIAYTLRPFAYRI